MKPEEQINLEELELLIELTEEKLQNNNNKLKTLDGVLDLEFLASKEKDVERMLNAFKAFIPQEELDNSFADYKVEALKKYQKISNTLVTILTKLYVLKTELQ